MSIPIVPRDMPVHHQQFLSALKRAIEKMQPSDIPPGKPSNLTVRPLPGGNQILFTGGDGADGHTLQISTTANWDPTKAGSAKIDLSLSTQYNDMVGQAGVTHYYWIVARRGNKVSDPPTGPVKGTTLGLNVAAANPIYVPPTPNIARSQATGKPTLLQPRKGGQRDTF